MIRGASRSALSLDKCTESRMGNSGSYSLEEATGPPDRRGSGTAPTGSLTLTPVRVLDEALGYRTDVALQASQRLAERRRTRDHHHVIPYSPLSGPPIVEHPVTNRLTQPPASPVTGGRPAQLPAHRDSYPHPLTHARHRKGYEGSSHVEAPDRQDMLKVTLTPEAKSLLHLGMTPLPRRASAGAARAGGGCGESAGHPGCATSSGSRGRAGDIASWADRCA